RTAKLPPRNPQSKYSAVVVFGDSYSDDEHRQSEPVKNPYKALARIGQNSTGILWPNILVKEMYPGSTPKLYDYAYNAAHANNHLTTWGMHIPDTRAEIQEYLSDVANGKISGGGGDIIYIWWIGINPIDAIWIDACDPTIAGAKHARYPTDALFVNATNRISLQVEEVRFQVQSLRAKVIANSRRASFMIVTVPNIDVAPYQNRLVQKWAGNDKDQQEDILKLLRLLIKQYNEGLQKAIKSIRDKNGEAKGFIRTYDIVLLWKDILNTPEKYGIKNVTTSCFRNNVVCTNVKEYFFWDSLHPTPSVETIFAHDMNRFISDQR
ncbi:hypothetical protein CROQUDRAFT_399994, partial [Cronartium quercuum f. sp. fusiforme G11]